MNEHSQYHIPPAYKDDDEIHIGPFFSNLKKTFGYVLRKWYVLLIFCIIFAGIALAYTVWYGKKYIATATFAVEGQAASSGLLSSALSLANALGIQTSTSKANVYNNNFFANLIQSRKIVKESLFEEATVKGKKDLLANHYMVLNKLHTGGLISGGWYDNPRLKGFTFKKKPLDQLTSTEDSLLNIIYDKIVESNLNVTFDEASPFNTATFTTRSGDFSKYMLKNMLDKTAGYYMGHVYELNRKNLRVAEQRVDSLGKEMRKYDYRVASLRDQTNNTFRQKGLVSVNDAERSRELLSTQYAAAVNNVELANVTALTSAPIIDVIDDPLFATVVSFVRWNVAMIVGIILGIFFGTVYLVIIRAIRLSNERMRERQLQEQQDRDTAAA